MKEAKETTNQERIVRMNIYQGTVVWSFTNCRKIGYTNKRVYSYKRNKEVCEVKKEKCENKDFM